MTLNCDLIYGMKDIYGSLFLFSFSFPLITPTGKLNERVIVVVVLLFYVHSKQLYGHVGTVS